MASTKTNPSYPPILVSRGIQPADRALPTDWGQSPEPGSNPLPSPVPSVQLPWAFHSQTEQEKLCCTQTSTLPAGPHLFKGQQHELLCLGHLHEVLEDVLVGRLEEVAAGVGVSKAPDAQAVGGVELAEQELAASVPHTIELKQAGSRKKGLAQ